MQEQNKSSFFDPKTIFAVVLVAAVWFGWQTYLTKKYPDYRHEIKEILEKYDPSLSDCSYDRKLNLC